MQYLIDQIASMNWLSWVLVIFLIAVIIMFIQDVFNRKSTIRHNFPVVGRIRYLLESVRPELRQYIVANNRDELPFNRGQRTWIYASSKRENNYQGFGSDKDFNDPGHIFINPAMMPYPIKPGHTNFDDPYFLPCAKVMGEGRRKRPFRPYSVLNISAMSFGSLSANAVSALNMGAEKVGCWHNTGEGSLSPYHSHGSDVVFHFGTGYFGCRDDEGNFSMEKMVEVCEKNHFVRAVEVKLSQGAKPGKGGVLPAKKISEEIARIRHVPMGQDVLSPAYHSAFSNIPELVDFVESIAESTGLPVGIKSAVGKLEMWEELAKIMSETGKGPDFITVDGGEGGTGAAPPSFADHVALPFNYGFANVYKIFQKYNLTDRVVFVGAGKLGFPANGLKAMAMGVDVINVAREAMMAIGCIQAQECHTNFCPAGVATQNKWLQSGLDPKNKSERFYHYVKTYRKEMLEITHACGYEHPAQMTMDDVDVSMGDNNQTQTLAEAYKYTKTPVKSLLSMAELQECVHMGGLSKKNKAKA